MRMSCNGCRVLRKGCSAGCNIRPCLQWMRSSESQSNATLFLAKFYGRAGLINLINSGPEKLRPAIFRSLLYEACGRIVNPINGSVGLMCTNNWHVCEAAVELVLRGLPITAIPSFQAHDIRHVPKNPRPPAQMHQALKNGVRFKRSAHPRACSAEPTATSEDSERTVTENAVELGMDLELRLAPPSARAG